MPMASAPKPTVNKALRPLFLLGLARRRDISVALTEIAVEVKIARLKSGSAVADKIGMCHLAQGQAQGAGRYGQGQGSLSHYHFSSCV
jgi:hypothetical protein